MISETIARRSVSVLPKRFTPKQVLALSKYMYIKRMLTHYDVKVIFDVGANTGQFALSMREIGFAGTIISFEPVREQFLALKEKSKGDPLWRIENFALGSVEQRREINLTAQTVFASFMEPTTVETPQFADKNVVVGKQEVEIRRFDRFVAEAGHDLVKQPFFLKTDTQGFDKEVLEGAGEVLSAAAMLMSEVSCIPIYRDALPMAEMQAFLYAKGFRPVAFFPNNQQGNWAAIEFDYLTVNSEIRAWPQP